MGEATVAKEMAETIRLVRQLFHLLKAVGSALHEELGVTVPMRGVLETIHLQGPTTVPRLARMRPVSRQHIQRIVDALLARNLVRLESNPDHKRSPLVVMTSEGEATFSAIGERERAPLARLTAGLSEDEAAVTRKVLAQLKTRLTDMLAAQAPSSGDNDDDAL